jgi:hypothetical protein
MSTITVNQNDNAQSKLDAANSGDTIQFVGVTLAATLAVRKSMNLSGTLTTARSVYAFEPLADNITVDRLTLDGLLFKMSAFRPANLLAQNCTFTVREGSGQVPIPNIPNWCLVGWNANGAPKSFKFINNTIPKCEAWCVMFGLQGNNIEIGNNWFENRQNPANPQNEGRFLKFFGQGANDSGGMLEVRDNSDKLTCGNLFIHHNYFGSCRGMAAEIQDGWLNNRWEDNYYEKPIAVGTNWQQNANVWCFSIVEARSSGCKVLRNFINGQLPAGTPSGCFRVAIEGGGFDQEIADNYIVLNGTSNSADGAGNSSIAINGSNASGNCRNNRIVNAPMPFNHTAVGAHMAMSNNGPNVTLTWDINRPKPGPGTPTTPPEPTVPEFKAAIAIGSDNRSAALTWPGAPTDTFTIHVKTTHGTDPLKNIGSVVGTSCLIVDLHSGWEYDFQINGVGIGGKISARIGPESLSTQTMPSNPTLSTDKPPIPPPVAPKLKKVTTILDYSDGSKQTVEANVP